jgi:hypothetical protein
MGQSTMSFGYSGEQSLPSPLQPAKLVGYREGARAAAGPVSCRETIAIPPRPASRPTSTSPRQPLCRGSQLLGMHRWMGGDVSWAAVMHRAQAQIIFLMLTECPSPHVHQQALLPQPTPPTLPQNLMDTLQGVTAMLSSGPGVNGMSGVKALPLGQPYNTSLLPIPDALRVQMPGELHGSNCRVSIQHVQLLPLSHVPVPSRFCIRLSLPCCFPLQMTVMLRRMET